MMKFFYNNHRIAHQLIIFIVLFSSIVTLVLTSLQLYQQYNYDIDLIESQFKKVELSNKFILEKSLWEFDYQTAELVSQGIMRNRNFVYLELVNHTGDVILTMGEKPVDNFRIQTLQLGYQHDAEQHDLGTFRVFATLDFVYEHLFDTALIILISQALKTFLVSLFILVVVWYLITRHLNQIIRHMEKLDMTGEPEELALNRHESSKTQNDELGKLVSSINSMHKVINQTYQDIEYQSLHDHLTGLPNRRSLERVLRNNMQLITHDKQHNALLFIDLDSFKLLNDSLGHSAGDEMLKTVAKRLNTVLEKGGELFRIGGDEFLILLSMLATERETATREAIQFADNVREVIKETIHLGGQPYRMTASVGIKLFCGSQENFESILKHADNAMYQSKIDGRDRISVYHAKMQEAADHRLDIERKLLQAIDNDEFELFYQPKYNYDRRIVGAEVLIRWLIPNGTYSLPDSFISIAEESGLILPIGDIVLEKVFQFAQQNQALLKRARVCDIAINISPYQIKSKNFTEKIIQEIGKYQLDAEIFTLEITEGAMIDNTKEVMKHLDKLKHHGFNLSIDDFGTGYSSLHYIRELPVGELKIDRSFVSQVVENKDISTITTTIITMAENLGLKVVAEGVETNQQFDLLVNQKCQLFQGNLFSRPVTDQNFVQLLEQQMSIA